MQLSMEMVTALLGFAGAFLVKEIWDFIKGKSNKDKEFLDKSLEKNTEAIAQLNLAILELKLRIDYLSEKLAPLQKMSMDVNEAHNKLRELKNQVELTQSAIK